MIAPPPLPELPPTGHRAIDTVHRRLADNLALLWAALDDGDRDQAMTLSVALLDCLRADYACEESLMQASAYPQLARHLQAHVELEIAFTGVARRIRDADFAFGPAKRSELRLALCRVAVELAAHVLNADVELAQFLDADTRSAGKR